MKILVYGAGAVGGYLGARLAHQNHDVTLVARPTTATMISEHGLFIAETDAEFRVRPAVVNSIAQAFMDSETAYDLIIMGMKAYDIPPAIDHLVAFCPDPAAILTIQNGINAEQPIIDQFGPEKVIAGAFTMPVRRETPNHLVIERSDRGFGLTAVHPNTDLTPWLTLFQQTAIPTEVIGNYRAMKWSKAFLNIIGNATSAILNRPPGVIYKSDAIFDLEARMLRETLAVMKALNIPVIDLPGAPAKRLAAGVRRAPRFILKPILTRIVDTGRGDKMPSFHIDLYAGKGKSEVLYHNGAIAKAGQEAGVPTPVNRTLTSVLWALTQEKIDWREFDGRPRRLIAALKQTEQQSHA